VPALLAALFLGAAALLAASPASAQPDGPFPPQAMLEQLRERLHELPDSPPPAVPEMEIRPGSGTLALTFSVESPRERLLPLPLLDSKLFQPVRASVDGKDAPLLARDRNHYVLIPQGPSAVTLEGRLKDADTFQISFPVEPKPLRALLTGSGWELRGVDPQGYLTGPAVFLSRIAAAGTPAGGAGGAAGAGTGGPAPDAGPAPAGGAAPARGAPSVIQPFFAVSRTISLGLELKIQTRVIPLARLEAPFTLAVPLVPGESPVTGLTVRDGKAYLTLSPDNPGRSWESALRLGEGGALELTASAGPWSEYWILDAASIWRVETEGLPPVLSVSESGFWNPEWRPAPGETLRLQVSRPRPVEGAYLVADRSRVEIQVGRESRRISLALDLRSSQGGNYGFRLPRGTRMEELSLDGRPVPFPGGAPADGEGPVLTVPLNPGTHSLAAVFTDPRPVSAVVRSPELDPGLPAANLDFLITTPPDRWTLFAGGPIQGPAVLFWSYCAAFLVFSFFLSSLKLAPLRTLSWLLFFLGLSQLSVPMAFVSAGWLLALGLREGRFRGVQSRFLFNCMQILLVLWTAAALFLIYKGLTRGLLEAPSMSVTGNGSYDHALSWFQDRSEGPFPRPWVVTIPGWVYRTLMLAWALWMAISVVRWLRWGWHSFSSGALWKRGTSVKRPRRLTPAQRMALSRQQGFPPQAGAAPAGPWPDPWPGAPGGPEGPQGSAGPQGTEVTEGPGGPEGPPAGAGPEGTGGGGQEKP
jgi:hypothetical protein